MEREIQAWICPRCGEWIELQTPIFSRVDQATRICIPCHKMEDIEETTSLGVKPRTEWRFPSLEIVHRA